jgi:putative DNA primase/helicase
MEQDVILDERELRKIPYKPREYIIEGLIAERSITIINGPRGCGKSYLAMAIANTAVRGVSLGPWEVGRMVNTLIVDGELPVEDLLLRIYSMSGAHTGSIKRLYFYSDAHLHELGKPALNLCEARTRNTIDEAIDTKRIGLVVLDNLSALCPGIDENEKVAFDPINRWLMNLRYRGVTVVEVHHTGKSGDQRGTSAHEDHVDLALTLSRPRGYRTTDGCKFVMRASKDRGFVFKRESITLQLFNRPHGLCDEVGNEYDWEDGILKFEEVEQKEEHAEFVQDEPKAIDKAEEFITQHPESNWRDAEAAGVAKATFFRAKRRAES